MKKNVLIRGYYGFRNTGDDALIYAILQSLMHIPGINFNVLTRAKIHHPNNIKNLNFIFPSIKNLLFQLFKADTLIFGGGSQLQDYGKLRMVVGMLKMYIIVKIMKLRGKRVLFLGVSIGPIETKIGNFISSLTLNNADFIAVRDIDSMEQMKKMSIDIEKTILCPDLAIKLKENIHSNNSKDNKMVIGLNLLPFYSVIKNRDDIEESLIINLANSLNSLQNSNKNLEVKLFSFQDNPSINDYKVLKKLSQKLNVQNSLYEYQDNPIKTLEEISTCNRFIGMRLHSSIFSYIGEIPQIILNYHPKCEGFAKSVDYPCEVLVDLTNIDYYELDMKIQSLVQEPDIYMPKVSVSKSSREVDNLFQFIASNYI
ncbi:hypothetical protein FC682_20050 [Peribacillus simplex]|uniref:polysaccharide pyruvyl transferase family protein n=1 Tax=Peribacillus simplex TaxID=1478 RepID=UPI0010BE34C3|nr:polysaccharide pyruvyl transferase family protein [Peribacillus simplex]TKH02931.1 hypothetical protein FC682_20050 [Peribacillus simplex]